MSRWRSTKAKTVLAALKRVGWEEVHTSGSHRKLKRGGDSYTFAFHDKEEIGPKMLSKIAKKTGLRPEDL